MVRAIEKLETETINRIAAGEVVLHPSNALKELLENSLDAGATIIQISAPKGGTEMLSIEDNGHGIRNEDLRILCHRFTTSKLKKYDDLGTIATYGFRGEALASLSHVAKVEVSTRSAGPKLTTVVQYVNGELQEGTKKQIAPFGLMVDKMSTSSYSNGMSSSSSGSSRPTLIQGTGASLCYFDMFYRNPERKRAMASPTEEYRNILEIIQNYAIHNPHVSFQSTKRTDVFPAMKNRMAANNMGLVAFSGGGRGGGRGNKKAKAASLNPMLAALNATSTASSSPKEDSEKSEGEIKKAYLDLDTQGGPYVTSHDMIRQIHGDNIAKSLLSLEFRDPALNDFQCKGLVSSPSYSGKKQELILFINNRLVENSNIKNIVRRAYSSFLEKGCHSFVYLSLTIAGSCVDVNVHPTKKEMHLMEEYHILQRLEEELRIILTQERDRRRMGSLGTGLTGKAKAVTIKAEEKRAEEKRDGPPSVTRVRTNTRQVSVRDMWAQKTSNHLEDLACLEFRYVRKLFDSYKNWCKDRDEKENDKVWRNPLLLQGLRGKVDSEDGINNPSGTSNVQGTNENSQHRRDYEEYGCIWSDVMRHCYLDRKCDEELTTKLTQSVWIGAVDTERCLLQTGKNCTLVNMRIVAEEAAFQLLLLCGATRQGIPGIHLNKPIDVEKLLMRFASAGKTDAAPRITRETIQRMKKLFLTYSGFLSDYIGLKLRIGPEEFFINGMPNPFSFSSVDPRSLLLKLPAWLLDIASLLGGLEKGRKTTTDGGAMTITNDINAITTHNIEAPTTSEFETLLLRRAAMFTVEAIRPVVKEAPANLKTRWQPFGATNAMLMKTKDTLINSRSGGMVRLRRKRDTFSKKNKAISEKKKKADDAKKSGAKQTSPQNIKRVLTHKCHDYMHEQWRVVHLAPWFRAPQSWEGYAYQDLVGLDQLYRVFERC